MKAFFLKTLVANIWKTYCVSRVRQKILSVKTHFVPLKVPYNSLAKLSPQRASPGGDPLRQTQHDPSGFWGDGALFFGGLLGRPLLIGEPRARRAGAGWRGGRKEGRKEEEGGALGERNNSDQPRCWRNYLVPKTATYS